jgi:hypothetical protein
LPVLALLAVAGTRAAAQPANDNFADAEEISGFSGSIGGSNVGATKQPGEPNHGLNTGGTSIWYVWQAPISGTAAFDTLGSTFDTTFGAYIGNAVGALTSVGQGDDVFDYFAFRGNWRVLVGSASRIRFPVQAGVIYHIAVDGYNDATPVVGDVVLNWQVEPRPANDNIANALVLTGDSGFLVAENAGATKETGEANHAGNSGGASIWFRWTPSISGTARILTGGSLTDIPDSMDTLLAVYTSTNIGSGAIAANDNNGTSLRSLVNFAVLSGTTYWIAVDGKNLGTGAVHGKIALTWTVGTPAANNSFANAKVLTGKCGLVKGSTFAATKEGAEPDHAGDRGGASVWFSWTAPESGPAVFSSMGSPFFDTLMGVYTGNSVNGLTEINSNDDVDFGNNIFSSRVEFDAVAGTTYRIALDGYRGTNAAASQSVYFLSWGNNVPLNDDFFGGEILNGSSGSVQGCNYFATTEIGEPSHGGDGFSIWYQWTPPASGVATISLESSILDTVLAVYTGDGVESLTVVAQNDDIAFTTWQSRVRFIAQEGVNYRIAVDSLVFDGPIQLDYSLSAPPILGITRTAGVVTINWAGPYRLQSTDALANPSSATVWTDVPRVSPVTLPINGAGNQFFRAIFP